MQRPRTIVLVDDAVEVRAMVRMKLRIRGRFTVVGEGGTGAEAIALVEELQPDVLLLDVSMPDVDGLEALARVRESSPSTVVVMFSGFDASGLAERAIALGAADFVEKSVPLAELEERLYHAVADDDDGADAPDLGAEVDGDEENSILAEQVERFRAAFDEAAIGMATLTLAGRIVRANARLEQLAGADPLGLVGQPYEALVGAEGDAMRAMVRRLASGAQDVRTIEHKLDGGRQVVSTVAVIRDSGGAPLYLFLQVVDVTDRRHAEEALQRSEERFRLLVESVQDYAIFMLDPTGHVASWNLGAERINGYRGEEIVGTHFSAFYLPEAVASGHPQYELAVAEEVGRYEEEGWRVRKDGSVFWANVVITAVRDGRGTLVGFAKVTRDITERRRLQEGLEQAASDRVQLLAVTAHELRSPVAILNGYATMLSEDWEILGDDDRRQMVDALTRSGSRLGRLVEDLFTSARLEAGGLAFEPAPIDLATIAGDAVRDLAVAGIACAIDSRPTIVLADAVRVGQMVENLLTNANRYGAPPIEVTVRTEDGVGVLSVADRGAGVPDELAGQLFERFARGLRREGTGLGLHIVREMARAQGGDAWYEPHPGGGSVFSLRLPLAVAP